MPFAHHVLASASASSSDDSLVLGLVPCAVGAPGSGYGPRASRSTRPSSPGHAPHWRTAAGWSASCCASRGRATPSRWTTRGPAAARQDGGPGRRSQGRYRIAQSACHPDTTGWRNVGSSVCSLYKFYEILVMLGQTYFRAQAPPSTILPSGSTLLDKACETLFSESELDGLHYQVIEIELDDGGYKGMPFVLRSGETWIKNNGSDFYLDFSTQLTKNIKGTGDAGKGTAKALLERIADLEEDAQRSLMHRCYWCNHSCSNAASTQGPNQTSGTTKRLVVIKDDSDHEVTVTLWGQRAKDFDAEYVYEKSQKKPIAILFVGVLMKRYGQNEGLSGGSACRWYISPNIPEATTIESRIVGEQYIGPNKITCYDHSQHYWTEDTD